MHGGELLLGAGNGCLESFDLAEPALVACLGESGVEVLEDLLEAVHLGGVGPEERAADAGVFMLAGGSVGSAADTELDLAALEVAKELVPFGVGRFRYSWLGRSTRRRAMKARWWSMTSWSYTAT